MIYLTGGLGFVTDMMHRYRANRSLLKNTKHWQNRSEKAHIPNTSPAEVKMKKDNPEKTEAILSETKNNQHPTRKNKTWNFVFWTIMAVGLLTIFIYLFWKDMI